MLTSSIYLDTLVYLFTYMCLYNISLFVFFWTLFNTVVTEFKNLYSFSNLSFNSFYVVLITILLLSMAGVPPFIGFFSKLFILLLLLNNSFFLLYSLLFILMFTGLYFYVQNLRFLHSTNTSTLNYPFLLNERHILPFYYTSITTLILLMFGVIYIDDVLLFVSWLLN